MSASHSSAPRKPNKPYPAYPLFAHASGQWAKKICGRLHYFGVWGEPDGALARYLEQKDALLAGRKPRQDTGEATVKEVANAFLNEKNTRLFASEISPRTMQDDKDSCTELIAAIGKGRLAADLDADDFGRLWRRLSSK